MSRHKLHTAGEVSANTDTGRRVLDEIRALPALSVTELKQKCQALSGQEPPKFAKRSLLTQLVAWEVQAQAFGGLKPSLHRQLLEIGNGQVNHSSGGPAAPSTPGRRPGVKLIRVWKGITHHVIVTEDGFLWGNTSFRSLSTIARTITGTPWSGPVFFGLKKYGTKRPALGKSPAVAVTAAADVSDSFSAEGLPDG